jgi:hypothetical protein
MKKLLKFLSKRFKYATTNRILRFKVKRAQRALANLGDRDHQIIRIVKSALADRRNRLMIAPLSGARYIKMPRQEMFIIISDNRVVISNHKFYYDLHTPNVLSEYLIQKFNQITNHQRDLMERDMLSNIKSGLSDIADKLDKKSKENGSKVREQFRQEPEEISLAQFQNL